MTELKPDKQIIAARLKALREKAGLSQAKLAKELKISQPLVARYETAVNVPSYAAMLAYADYFDVSCDWLIGRCDDPEGMKCARYMKSADETDAGVQEAWEKCLDPDSPSYAKFREAVLEVVGDRK
ncbi:MAG: helix-turn-helix domain-containing protein [Clostridia bacterium]|nr:helix-turn-helix domain-containing protein [Clostridia bacterium]